MASNGLCTAVLPSGEVCGEPEDALVHKGAYGGLYFTVGRHPWSPCTDENCEVC